MTAFNDTFGIIGLSSENVGIDRRIYTGLTSTNPQLNVSYNGGRVDVYLNGVKLMGNHSGQSNYDYTYQSTGSGSAITLSTGVALVATDTIECVGYVSNSSNTVTSYNPTPANTDGGWNVFASISHSASDLVNVFLNGVLLDDSDYTLDASANTVTIGGATLTASDVVVIQVIGALDHSDFVSAGGGTFSGNVAYTGNIQVDDIVEKTSAHGVEIDGVTLKDGGGTFTGNVVIPDGGNIGSASDTDAISISSGGVVTASASIQTDTINEKTSANGVSIDGLKIKDYSLMYGSNTGIIITSSGYVIKPNIPSWYFTDSGSSAAFSADNTADWDQVSGGTQFTSGGCTVSSGVVTVPVNGLYHIGAQMLSNVASRMYFHIRVNGTGIKGSYIETVNSGTTQYQTATSVIIHELSANDTVSVYVTTFSAYASNYANFHGYLIG